MTQEFSDSIYTKEDIEKAFNIGFATALTEFERLIDLSHNRQMLLLQSMKNMFLEAEDSSFRAHHNRNKIVSFQSYMKK